MPAPKMPPVQYELIRLTGGLDLVTPTLSLPPGVARDAVNWECSITGGYTRIAGYERFDGRPNPSDAQYAVLTIDAISTSVAVGSVVTGAVSGATGQVIYSEVTVTGPSEPSVDLDFVAAAYSTFRYSGFIVVTKQTGAFSTGEDLAVSGSVIGSVAAFSGVVADGQAGARYRALAADVYRADIQAVPGSGQIRGIQYFNGLLYAWRNNAGGTGLDIYKSSSTGWTSVPLGYELSFINGVSAIVDGNTVTGQTSGATGVVSRVVQESGSWSTNDAAGRLILSSTTGTFLTGENLRVSGVTRAHAGGAASAISLLPDGRVEMVVANFGGSAATTRIYGCDGVNRAFEFDGTVYTPLSTGMPTDTPLHVAFHKNHLFLSFGSSVQFSAIGDPYVWNPVFGAGEIALVDNVTQFLVLPGDQSTGALAIYTDTNTFILYGTSEANFNLVSYNVGTGAKAYTGQNLGGSYVFDDRGVMSLQTTLNYGNFDSAAMTLNIRPFTQQRRNIATASIVNREKGQYRVFFSDGSGLYLTFANSKYLGAMPVQFPDPVMCICEGENPNGPEVHYFGSTDGFVYRLDAGTSFDGDPISSNLLLTFDSIRSPRILKRYRKASLEVTGTGFAQFGFSYSLGYGTTTLSQPVAETVTTNLTSSFWDSAIWDAFVWDGRTLMPSEVAVEGTAENIAIQLSSLSDYFEPFTLNTVILHYTPRRGLR